MKSILLSIVLALSLVPHCLSQTTYGANYTPSNGTVVAGLPETIHSFNCDQFSVNNDPNVTTQITTAWTLENFLGLSLVSISKDDHPEFAINGTERGSSLPFPTFRNQLTIVNLTHRLHNVRLYCGHGQDTTDGFWDLRVYTPPLLNTNEQLSAIEGDSVRVDLSQNQREAFPFPRDFEWQRDSVVISNTTRSEFGYPLLNINPVSREDIGTYTLSATNSRLGDSESIIGTGNGRIELEIFYGPEIAAAESALAAVELGNVTLVCGANLVGHPAPNVQWRNSADVVIDSTDTNFVFNDGPESVSLTILSAQLTDTGNWTCTLSSNETVVTVERMLPLTVITRPPPPVNVTINERGATWFYVSWVYPPDPSTYFTLTATSSNNEPPLTLTVEEPQRSANLTSLSPGTQYSVSVVASSLLHGIMAASESSVPVIDSTNTSVPVLDCSKAFSSDGVATVSWTLNTGGLNLTSLEAAYATPEAVDFTPVMMDLNYEQRSLSVGGLSAGEFYTFRISASNPLGETVSVCPALWLTTGIPQTPLIHTAISNNPLQALVNVSTSASGTGPSDSSFQFLIQVMDTNSSSMFETSIPHPNYRDGAIVELTVSSGFVQGGDFIFAVRANNRYGTSPFSEPVRVKVADSEPAKQLPVAAIAGGVGGVLLLLLLVAIVILVVVCIVCSKKTDTESKIQRCDSLEMVPNENYGKFSEGVDTPTPHNPQYDTIPVHSQGIYDQLAPPIKETLSDNPLYSSTGELRMSAVFNTYNPKSRENSNQLTPSQQNIPLPPRPDSYPAHSITSSAQPTYSTPSARRDTLPLPNNHVLNREHLYTGAPSNRAPPSESMYSEL